MLGGQRCGCREASTGSGCTSQVGDGAGELEHAVVGARRDVQLAYGRLHEALAGLVQPAVLAHRSAELTTKPRARINRLHSRFAFVTISTGGLDAISHDLAIVSAMAHRVLVMKDGVIIEQGEAEALFDAPREPYTKTLLAAAQLA